MEEAPLLLKWVALFYTMAFGFGQFHHVPLLFILSLEVPMYVAFSCDNVVAGTTSLDIVVPLITLPKICLSIKQPCK